MATISTDHLLAYYGMADIASALHWVLFPKTPLGDDVCTVIGTLRKHSAITDAQQLALGGVLKLRHLVAHTDTQPESARQTKAATTWAQLYQDAIVLVQWLQTVQLQQASAELRKARLESRSALTRAILVGFLRVKAETAVSIGEDDDSADDETAVEDVPVLAEIRASPIRLVIVEPATDEVPTVPFKAEGSLQTLRETPGFRARAKGARIQILSGPHRNQVGVFKRWNGSMVRIYFFAYNEERWMRTSTTICVVAWNNSSS